MPTMPIIPIPVFENTDGDGIVVFLLMTEMFICLPINYLLFYKLFGIKDRTKKQKIFDIVKIFSMNIVQGFIWTVLLMDISTNIKQLIFVDIIITITLLVMHIMLYALTKRILIFK